MLEQFFSCPVVLQRLHIGPLGPYIDIFATVLSERGYARRTIRRQIQIISYLNRWLHRLQLSVKELNEGKIAKFIQQRRRRCYIHRGDAPTLRLFVEHLQDINVIPTPIPKIDDSELGRIERSFVKYLVGERKLSQSSLYNTLPYVRQFLTKRFGKGPILLKKLCPSDITNFILQYAHSLSPGRAKLMVWALRSFFRFLYLQGNIDTDLAAAVPTVPNWKFATIPKYVSRGQVERLLKSCNQNTITGQRDYTILLFFARLGLRASEVVNMTLDDIDWEAGEIMIRGKGSRQDRLPLPKDVGKALVAYLRHGRPSCSSRQVFIRIKAPRRGFIGASAIRSLVGRAFERAGVQAPQRGSHILRHSLATEMLRKGASLAEISEILRHKQLNTTEIYIKINLEALRALAQGWPGGGT